MRRHSSVSPEYLFASRVGSRGLSQRGTKLVKIVRSKSPEKHDGLRLSARGFYDQYGSSAVGQSKMIRQPDGSMKKKYLRIKATGSPFWSTK